MTNPEIEVIIEADGYMLPYTIQNSVIYKHSGHMACVNCIFREDNEGKRSALFESEEEQETLIYYGWEPVYLDHPYAEILDAYYLMNGLPPEARN